MKSSHPLILITNDDGHQAAGLQALTRAVAHLGEVYVVAPDGARSGAAASITCTIPVSFQPIALPDQTATTIDGKALGYPSDIHLFACSGTPVDSVKLALEQILPRTPDLILSGINHGDNASVSVHYSGTMGAVVEGCLKGIPSIGISLYLPRGQRYEEHPVCDAALDAIGQFCQRVILQGLPQDICLNINLPLANSFRGWQVCRQARGQWTSEWATASNPHGQKAFWMTGTFNDLEPEANDTDFAALRAGYGSIVPITVDMTAHHVMEQISTLLH